MSPSLEQEIRDLRSRFWSERDPEGRAFAPLADACRRAGDLDEAVELLSDGLGRHPEFVTGHVVAAWVHRDRADLSASEGAFRRALDLDPENARALHGLGQLLARGGRVAAGRELVMRAVELDPLLEWEEGAAPGGQDGDDDPGAMPAFPALGAEPPPQDLVDEAIDTALEEPTPHDSEVAPEPAEESEVGVGVEGVAGEAPMSDGIVDAIAPGVEGDDHGSDVVVEPASVSADTREAPVPDESDEADEDVEDVAVVDIRALAPEAVDGMLGDPDGRGAIVEIAALAPAAAPGHGEPPPELTEWSAPWSDPPSEASLQVAPHATGDTARSGATVGPPDEGGDVVVDIRDLAPGPLVSAAGEAAALAGEADADEEEADADAERASAEEATVAEEAEPADEAAAEAAAEAAEPAEPGTDAEAVAGEAEPADAAEEPEELLYTRTMADLYARQGLYTQALEVVRHLRRRRPDDTDLATRQAELEARLDAEGDRTGRRDPEPTPETVRRSALAAAPALIDPTERVTVDAGAAGGDPGAATDADADSGGESIREYLQGLLAWPDRRRAPADGDDPGRLA